MNYNKYNPTHLTKNSLEYIKDQVEGINALDSNSPVEFVSVYDSTDIRLVLTFKEITNEDDLILELKSVEEIKGIHEAQILTYMKLAHIHQGLLINFNVPLLKDGLRGGNF